MKKLSFDTLRENARKHIINTITIGWYVPESELESPCWFWKGSKTDAGYGSCRRLNKQLAHQVSYIAFCGEIRDNLFVCHECDNRICVNPDHLWLGTGFDNMEDSRKKGRLRGEKNPSAKLTELKIQQIFHRQKEGLSRLEISTEFNISQAQLSTILQRKHWKHVNIRF